MFSVIMAITITSSKIITFEYVCDYSEKGPKFYGFPFIQETGSTWVNSMSGEIYVLGFLGNLLFWLAIIGSLFFILSKIMDLQQKSGQLIARFKRLHFGYIFLVQIR